MNFVEHIVESESSVKNISEYILENIFYFPSKKSIVKSIKNGNILLDGMLCRRDANIIEGQTISYKVDVRTKPKVFELKLDVLYEDEFVAVVEKLPGYPVNGNRYKTIENAMLFNLSESKELDALEWPMPVHRLDLATGGLLLVAKTRSSQVELGWQFQNKIIKKKYVALVSGLVLKGGTVDIPLDGKTAFTRYEVVQNCNSLQNEFITMLELFPETGRYHQLRQHLSEIGFPIVGDKEYGVDGNILSGKGLFLWAVELSFVHPESGDFIEIGIMPPDKFENLMLREEKRWKKYNN